MCRNSWRLHREGGHCTSLWMNRIGQKEGTGGFQKALAIVKSKSIERLREVSAGRNGKGMIGRRGLSYRIHRTY